MAAELTIDAAIGAARDRLRAVRAGAAGSALGVFAVRVAAAGFGYVAQVTMARLMGEAEYGIFGTVWVWIAILGHGATLGLSQGACRFLPADQARGRLAEVRGFLIGSALASMAGGLAVSVLGLLVLHLEGTLLAGPYGAPILVAALVLPLFAFQDYLEGVARSQNWAVLAIAPPYLLRQGLIMAAMLAAVLGGAPPRASVAVACTLLATGLSTAVQGAWLFWRLRPLRLHGPRRTDWRVWLTACLPIAAGDLATAACSLIDVVLLGFLMPPAAVGLYFAATRIQQFVVFVHYAASAATAQRFSAARARDDHDGLDALVRGQARWVFAATALVGLGVLVASPLLLAMFGPAFRDSLPVLAILVAGSVAASLFGPGEDLLTMLGGERICAGLTLGALALGAGLCLSLVPWLGLNGAAIATATAMTARAAGLALATYAVHGLVTPALPDRLRARIGRRAAAKTGAPR